MRDGTALLIAILVLFEIAVICIAVLHEKGAL